MKRTTFGKAAISSLVVATTMVGCTGAAFRPHATAVNQKSDAGKFASEAGRALSSRDGAKAVPAAEAAVRAAPQNATYRQLLGRAYVADGRFVSAETALTDAMTLGNADARTIVSLALVKVALGKGAEAHDLLVANADKLPAADYGLALAMAGDPVEGVRVLTEAVDGPSSSARTRQNLAYAYALAGRWKDARVMVGQDLDPLAANQRIQQWAMIAEPSLAPQRVAAVMGVAINASDAGQPAVLALAPAPSTTPVQTAEAAAAPQDAAPVDSSLPTVVQTADVAPAMAPAAPAAPVIAADPAPARVAAAPAKADALVRERSAAAGKAAKSRAAPALAVAASAAKAQQIAYIKPVEKPSNWVVQLGAFDTAAIAKEKWLRMAQHDATLAAFPVLTSQVTVKGKAFSRLAISGFAGRADAMSLCKSIQAQRGQCFVREGAPGATPQRWAVAAKGRQYASR
jgi:Flp pilus assembly protein TadD